MFSSYRELACYTLPQLCFKVMFVSFFLANLDALSRHDVCACATARVLPGVFPSAAVRRNQGEL